MKRVYVLDTNVLLHDPDAIDAFGEHDVVIPMAALEELDRHKNRQDDVGRNARCVNRILDKKRVAGSLLIGVTLRGGGVLRVVSAQADWPATMPVELRDPCKVDNCLIALARQIQAAELVEVTLVTRDINMRLKCDALGVLCTDYQHTRVAADTVQFYAGVEVCEEAPLQLIDAVCAAPITLQAAKSLGFATQRQALPNQFIILRHTVDESKRSVVVRCTEGSLQKVREKSSVFGLRPRNKEQLFALDLLTDQRVQIVTLLGPSGTGKTLLALAAGLEQVNGVGPVAAYEKLIVMRPVQTVGRDLGFLPGTLHEKMEPWTLPICDNLEQLTRLRHGAGKNAKKQHESSLAGFVELGKIEIEAIAFVRGRSIPQAFIVIDEAQNLTLHELKTIITRAGEGSKIVLLGDIEQIDRSDVDIYTNGLSYAVERFKSHEIAGHVTLLKGCRSALATLASSIL